MLRRTLLLSRGPACLSLRAPPALHLAPWASPRCWPASVRAQSSSSGGGGEGKAEGMSTSPDAPPDGATGAPSAAPGAGGAAEEVARLKASVVELNGARLRLLAEMENVRRIALRDVDTAKTYALQSFAKRLLDVADNLRRAVDSVPEASRGAPGKPAAPPPEGVFANLYAGVAATEKELLKAMASVGIEGFGTAGERFDPNRHEAMAQVPATAAHPDQTVASVLKAGFKMKDRIIRPAQVAVAKAADE